MADSSAVRMIQHALGELLEGLKRLEADDDWVDQDSSPIGKRPHLAAVRRGDLVASKVGHKVLVRRGDLDAYIAKHRVKLTIAPTPAEAAKSAEDAREDELQKIMHAEPRRRRRTT